MDEKVIKSKDEEHNKILRYYHPTWSQAREADGISNHQEFVAANFGNTKGKSYQELS